LFEYDYSSEGLRIRPHLPPGITRYIQKKAVVFGSTKVYLKVTGNGKVTSATANDKKCVIEADEWISIKDLDKSKTVSIEIVCGNARAQGAWKPGKKQTLVFTPDPDLWNIPEKLKNKYHVDLKKLKIFYEEMARDGLEETYEGAMARTALELLLARYERGKMREAGTLIEPDITPLPKCNQDEVENFYLIMAHNIAGGLTDYMSGLTIWEDVKPNARAIEIAKKVNLFPLMRTADDLVLKGSGKELKN
jgi:hypothetical protein